MEKEDLTLREKIIFTFIVCFNEKGPLLTLDDVCSKIHISKKTLYTIFSSKEEIYKTIISETAKEIYAKEQAIYDEVNESLIGKLYKMIITKVSYEGRVLLWRINELAVTDPKIYRLFLKTYNTQWDFFSKVLTEAKEKGILRNDISNEIIVNSFVGAIEALFQGNFLIKNRITATEAVIKLVDMFLKGLQIKEEK